MAKLKKSVFRRDLFLYRVFIEDTDPTSKYFKLSEIPDVLTSGKNAFLINGSDFLVPTTRVLVEIIDAKGETIFTQPIKGYEEGLARVQSIEVYEDAAPGLATITILGEATHTPDGQPVPPEWTGKYNVKWQRQFNVQPMSTNSSKVRLYETPTLTSSEILVQYRTAITSSMISLEGSGSLAVTGNPFLSSSTTTYILTNVDIPLSRSYEGSPVYSSAHEYTSSILEVLNTSSAVVANDGISSGFDLSPIRIDYQPSPEFFGTALTRSYADIQLAKLTTFSGDIARAKIYVKSIDQPADYQLIEDIILESRPILVTSSLTDMDVAIGDRDIYLGYFDSQNIIDEYWISGIADISLGYIETGSVVASYISDRLVDAMHISSDPSLVVTASVHPQYYIGLKTPVSFQELAEYTFSGKFVCVKSSESVAKLEVYVSGSSFPSVDPLGVKIQSYSVGVADTYKKFDPAQFNFVSSRDGTATLNFVIYGGDWHISDVEIDSARETGFNPDEARVLAPIINRRFERLQFKAELYDPNNNIVPVLIESEPVFFDGGNYVFKGLDHRIEGEIQIIPSGANADLTAIKLTTRGFFSGGRGGPPGAFSSGSSIHIGSGSVFTKDTPFIVGADISGSPEIAIGDKLYGYIDQNTDQFVLKILGTILIGSGSNFVDIRKLLPRNPKDAQFSRVSAYAGDFYDLRGRYAVSSGEWDDQITRMGHYTRAKSQEVLQPPLSSSNASATYNGFATQSIRLISSCSLIVPDSEIGVNNNTLYLNANLAATEHSSSTYFNFKYSATSYASWTGWPDPDIDAGVEFAGDTSIGVVEPGSVINNSTENFPIVLPTPRTGNQLYLMVVMDVETTPAV